MKYRINKYCVFFDNVYDDTKLIWEKGKQYLVIYEDETIYQFNNNTGIDKAYANELFKVEYSLKFNQNQGGYFYVNR